MKQKEKKLYAKIALVVIASIFLIGLVFLLFLGGENGPMVSSNSPQEDYVQSINEVQLEFIPSSISKVDCEVGKSCIINFQVKNIGNKKIHVSPGSFTENEDITYYSVGSQNSAYLSSEETSQILSVNAFATNLESGNYQIKIPLQVYDESGKRIGESVYYLTGTIYYSS